MELNEKTYLKIMSHFHISILDKIRLWQWNEMKNKPEIYLSFLYLSFIFYDMKKHPWL